MMYDLEKLSLEELIHYGVLGMHWGHRKKKETSTNQKTSRWTPEQKKKFKRIAIILGVTIGVVIAAYFVRRYLLKYGSRTLKPGTGFQHVAKILDEDFSKPVYVSYLKSDNKSYLNEFATWKGAPYVKTLKNTKPVKIAGSKDVLKCFSEWSSQTNLVDSTGKSFNGLSDKQTLKRAYRHFNYIMVSPDLRDQNLRDSFFSYLENKGFSAIHDLHDQDAGNVAPLIMFGKNSGIMQTKIKDLDPSILSGGARNAYDFFKSLEVK